MYDIPRYDGYEIETDPDGSFVEYDDMAELIDKIKQNHQEEVDDLRAEAARLRSAVRNVRNNLELHADDWQDSYRLVAIAVLSDALEE